MAIFRSKVQGIRTSVESMQEQLDTYLEDINLNSQELMENRVMIQELNERMCKLSDSVAALQQQLSTQQITPDPLTLREQEVFLVVYMASEPLSYAHIARQLSLPVGLVQDLVVDMLMKHVPFIRTRKDDGKVSLGLDPLFKEEQSKQNILGIHEGLSKQLSSDLQLSLFE